MYSNGIGGGDDGSCDDVVPVEQATSDRFAYAIDVDGRGQDEGHDEDDCRNAKEREHQDAKPADVEAILCGKHVANGCRPPTLAGGAKSVLQCKFSRCRTAEPAALMSRDYIFIK